MIKKLYKNLKKQFRNIKGYTQPHPVFSAIDRMKLSKIKRGDNKNGFLTIRPKGWKQSIKIRKNFIDKEVVEYVLIDKYHLPPKGAKLSKAGVILDLGSNIGLTIAHLKQVYPSMTIYGYEMNTNNYLLAKRNTNTYKNVQLNNQAIWIDNTTVAYSANSDFDAYSINHKTNNNDRIEIEATSILNIIEKYQLNEIDYVKMDIEGAEKHILKQKDIRWLQYVKSINLELHLDEGETIKTYIDILKNSGFNAWEDNKHWSSIMAVRKVD